MFSNKLILQSLVTIPKKLQGVATISSSKLLGPPRAKLLCAPLCIENNKNETCKNIVDNLTGTGKNIEIHRKISSLSIPMDENKKVRKVNRLTQVTKSFNINRTHTKYPHRVLAIRSGNKIPKHKTQNAIRFMSNRSSVLPPPSSGNSKIIEIPEVSGENPIRKMNVKFNGTIPPPTSPNNSIIREHTKDMTATSFNITMSKGRKVRPPSGNAKRCMCSNSIDRKFDHFTLFKNVNILPINSKFLIHTTPSMSDEDKSKSILNITNILNPNDGTILKGIYYKLHFPQQFLCPFLKQSKRNFMKSYVRPASLPPPTPKSMKEQTSNSELAPLYNLKVKNDLTVPTALKEQSKSPLMDLLEKTRRVVENGALQDLDLNLVTTDGVRKVYDNNHEDPKKAIYVKMQDGAFTRNNSSYNNNNENMNNENQNIQINEQQYMEKDNSDLVDIVNEHKKRLDHDKATFEARNPPAETEQPAYNYSQPNTYEDQQAKAIAEKNEAINRSIEEQESAVYTESPDEGDQRLATQIYQNYMQDHKNYKNDETMHTKMYNPGYSSNSSPNVDNEPSNRANFQSSYNPMSTMLNAVGAGSSNKTEPKYNFHAAAISNALAEKSDDKASKQNEYNSYKPSERQENKFFFQGPYMNMNMFSSPPSDTNKTEDNDATKLSYNSASDIDEYDSYEKQQMKINFQSADMKNTSSYMDGTEAPAYNNEETPPPQNRYFSSANRIEEDIYNNQNFMNHNMPNTNMNMGQVSRKPEVRNTGQRIMNKLKSMKNSRGLAELAKSFNHSSMFIPKQNLWKKFKFPAPSPSFDNQTEEDSSPKTTGNDKYIPKFQNFKEAREYFVEPENLKKLTPAQVAMYNSILYYENVVNKHAEEIKRQKDNLETTQNALKERKNKFNKNKCKE